MKPVRTWVLIADGARARILEHVGPGRGLTAVEGMIFDGDHRATHDLMSDREGRSYSSHDARRSAIEPRSDPHRDLKSDFVRRLVDILSVAADKNSFDRLVIAAAPVTLGDLRTALPDRLRAMTVGEIARDLTKVPNAEIPPHLASVLAV